MHEGTLPALEFDRVVAAVRSLTLTPLGAAAIDRLAPETDAHAVAARLAATSQGVAYLEANAPFGLDAPADLQQTVAALAVEGRVVEPPQLVGLARFLASVDGVCSAFEKAAGGPYPALDAVLDSAHSFEREVNAIRGSIDPEGEVLDDASPKLRTLRDRLRRQRNRLRGTLESYLRGRDTAKYLQERVVTERSGRFVLVVRSEHRASIPGIVHGSSGSGASLFLEPLSTVEINNDIVALEEQESDEIHRILLSLADTLRRRALDLRHTLAAAEELDVIQARASFSRLVDGVEPKLAGDARIELPQARHPLLMPAVRERAGERWLREEEGSRPAGPVPVDLRIAPPVGALIVTGPNTGGKTVALKTVGLLVLMAQAGLHIPAGPAATLPVFQSVFADIGDEQSIADSLSTFSRTHCPHRGHGEPARPARPGPARRGRRGHRPGRRRRTGRRDHRSLPAARRSGCGHYPRRHAEVVRVDDRRRRLRRLRLPPGNLRTHLRSDVRLARSQPGPGDSHAPGGSLVDRRRRTRPSQRPRGATGRAPCPRGARYRAGECAAGRTGSRPQGAREGA